MGFEGSNGSGLGDIQVTVCHSPLDVLGKEIVVLNGFADLGQFQNLVIREFLKVPEPWGNGTLADSLTASDFHNGLAGHVFGGNFESGFTDFVMVRGDYSLNDVIA